MNPPNFAHSSRFFPAFFQLGLILTLAAIGLSACSPDNRNQSVLDDKTRERAIPFEVWQPPQPGKHPLILFSHGSGGDYHDYLWLIETLVADGFIVAALNHPGNTARDSSDEGVMRVWDRPQDLSALLDFLLSESLWSSNIDPTRIGAAGHSAGGYTVLALAGAKFIPPRMGAYCSGPDRGPDCDLANPDIVVDESAASNSYLDPRIRAVFAMAPALGPGIDLGSMEAINTPIFLTATKDDELLLVEQHAVHYAEFIPTAQLNLIPAGGHFVYMDCAVTTQIADWFIAEFDLCGNPFKVDKAGIRNSVAIQAVEFFEQNLTQPGS